MIKISRRFDERKSTKESFKNLRYGPRKLYRITVNLLLPSRTNRRNTRVKLKVDNFRSLITLPHSLCCHSNPVHKLLHARPLIGIALNAVTNRGFQLVGEVFIDIWRRPAFHDVRQSRKHVGSFNLASGINSCELVPQTNNFSVKGRCRVDVRPM